LNKDVKVSVGIAGTGGGMKKFYAGQIDICDASRPIKQEEIDAAKKNGIEYTEFKVAFDGLSVIVNKGNDWVKSLTVDQLKAMWEPDSKIKTWKDMDASWPAEPIKFYSPGTDSGTFEYFTEEITGKKGAIRTDITPSEDDNVLVTGVANDKNAIGYFGYAYYLENKDKLKIVPVDSGAGPVEPAFDTIKNGTYKPLSRPLFIYVNNKKLAEDHIKEFIRYYLTEGKALVGDVGYVPLEDAAYETELVKIK
ncbi:MAG: PstS family phosphate ABC transporter substrate-binding protein, partial [Ruminiclostridium sp.]|nr:PstS family phosphate ABC transporter substrate-binding protein [Ruminiclostridium sp.]